MAKRQPEKRKKIPSIDLQVTAATFTWAILLPLCPWGSQDSFRESVLGRVLSAASARKSNSLRGLNKEAGWLQAEVSPCSQGTAKNPGSFHRSTNPPSICQLYPLAGSPHRDKAAVVATSIIQTWQVSEEERTSPRQDWDSIPLTLQSDTRDAGQAHGHTRQSSLQRGSLLWSTWLIIEAVPDTQSGLLGVGGS